MKEKNSNLKNRKNFECWQYDSAYKIPVNVYQPNTFQKKASNLLKNLKIIHGQSPMDITFVCPLDQVLSCNEVAKV